MVSISKQEYVQLKWDAQYWQMQHQRTLSREAELKARIEALRAQVRDLRQRLFGRKTEKSSAQSEQQSQPQSKRARGQQRGSVGHGRVDFSHLPAREEEHDVGEAERCCPTCGKAAAVFPGTEDSEVIEIEVQAYRRVIRRQRYRPSSQCEYLPGIMTAPMPARLIPKGILGISVWVEILLGKYLVCFRQGCVTRLVTARIELGGWVGAGVAMCKGYLVIPGHPVGGVRCDNRSVAL